MAQFMESERKNILLVFDKFKFSKVIRPSASGSIKWQCTIKTLITMFFLKTFGETTNIAEQNDVTKLSYHSANR